MKNLSFSERESQPKDSHFCLNCNKTDRHQKYHFDISTETLHQVEISKDTLGKLKQKSHSDKEWNIVKAIQRDLITTIVP